VPSGSQWSFMTDTDIAKSKAEASFKRKEQQAREGAVAMSEYIAGQNAVRAKTERLRALRLAKEAAKDAAPAKPEPKKATRRAPKS
jgi:hypothetical protein